MKQMMTRLQKMQIHQHLTAFLVGLTLAISAVIVQLAAAPPAQAAPNPVEARTHQTSPEPVRGAEGGLVESVKDTAETVREKLNLDQPLPESTKDFFKQVQGEDVEVEEHLPPGKARPIQRDATLRQ